MSNPTPCHVYVMACGDRTKVGRSIKPEERRKTLEFGSGLRVTLEFCSDPILNASAVEAAAHVILADKRSIGEWFSVDAATAIGAVEKALSGYRGEKKKYAAPFSMRLDVDLANDLKALAEAEGKDMTTYVRLALTQYLDHLDANWRDADGVNRQIDAALEERQ